MGFDKNSGKTKHIITQHNIWVNYGNGRGGLHAATFCGWLYDGEQMEGGYPYDGWWNNPKVSDVCPLCRHVMECGKNDPQSCRGCRELAEDAKLGHPLKREGSR